jgi:hypothetical protein
VINTLLDNITFRENESGHFEYVVCWEIFALSPGGVHLFELSFQVLSDHRKTCQGSSVSAPHLKAFSID